MHLLSLVLLFMCN